MRLTIIIFFLSFVNLYYSQNYADKSYYLIDSLDLSTLTDSDREIIDTCLKIYHNSSSSLTSRIGIIDDLIAGCWDENTWTSYNDFNYNLIIKLLNSNDKRVDKDTLIKYQANCLNNYGYYYQYKGNINKSLDYYNESAKLRLSINDSVLYISSILNIGNLYDNLNESEEAKSLYEEALALSESYGDEVLIARSYSSIGGLSFDEKNTKKAFNSLFRAIELYEKNNYSLGLSAAYSNLAFMYSFEKDYINSFKYYNLAINVREDIGDKKGLTFSYSGLGDLYLELENINMAKMYAKKAYELSQEIGSPRSINTSSKILSKVFEIEGNYKKSLELFKIHIIMKDSLLNSKTQKDLINHKYEVEYEKQKAIDEANLLKERALQKKEEERQKLILYFSIGVGGIILIFLYLVYIRLKESRKQNFIIKSQKEVVDTAHKELAMKNKEVLDSIIYAKRIQSAILPPKNVLDLRLNDYFIFYKPKDIVAGDFYWLEHQDDYLFFAVADCTGHGVPGAMVSVVCNNGLNRSVREHKLKKPNQILNKTREIVIQEFEKSEEEVKDGMDIALCSLKGNVLNYSGANNPLWILRKNTSQIEEIKANKQPIGVYVNSKEFDNHELELNNGDVLYLFSDGYQDQFGGVKQKKFKSINLKKLLISIKDLPLSEQKYELIKHFDEWKGDIEQLDDVCILVYKHRVKLM